jgi:hypothetical protein
MEIRPPSSMPATTSSSAIREAKLEALRAMLLKRSVEFQKDSAAHAEREDGKGTRLDIRV